MELDNTYNAEQEKYIKNKVTVIENAHENNKSRLASSVINEISGRKKTNTGKIKANSPEEHMQLWKEHFVDLLDQPPTIDDLPVIRVLDSSPIETGDFTEQELEESVKRSQNSNATGLDSIPAEAWKAGSLKIEILTIKPIMEMYQKYGSKEEYCYSQRKVI